MSEVAPSPAGDAESGQARPGGRALVSLVILSGIVGLNTVDRGMFSLLLPQIQHDIRLSDTALGFVMGPAFVIVYSLAGVPIAWLADRTSRRTIIAAGLAFWSAATALTGAAASHFQLLAARMSLGVGEASNMAPTSALIGDMFRGRWRVMAMSVFSAGGPLAIMMFYPLIGTIAAGYGWRLAYPMMGAIGLAVALLTLLVVREPPRDPSGLKAEVPGGFFKSSLDILKSPAFGLLCAAGVMISINYSAMVNWLPAFMTRVHGLDASETGSMIGVYKGLLGVVATLAGGVIVSLLMRLDRRWLAWAPMICALGMVPAQMLLLLANGKIWWHVGLGLETVFMQGITPALFALLITMLDSRVRATGAALYLLIFNLIGQSAGPYAVGVLNDGLFSSYGTQAVRYSLLTAPAVAVLGGALLFVVSLSMAPSKEEPTA